MPNPETTGWQPIETAPKDGTHIDLWVVFTSRDPVMESSSDREPDAWWHETAGWVRTYRDGDYCGEIDPIEDDAPEHWNNTRVTHWMPIPEPPR